ncbi:hypothetical protein [uncultured Psychrobacter sp.]|uniref:LPS-assembly lipoprotein LptE n=1 Tax=uncultured Psychrobacter sp. TaxID=259303 RepID=UPI0026076EFA|nr:hypothetical protein [uncultured Psychrobacter sp.]
MAYQQQNMQSARKNSLGTPAKGKSLGKTLATSLLAVLPMMTVVTTATVLTGCGFHLRGLDAPLNFEVEKTAVVIEDNRRSFPLKLPLTRRLETLGVDVVDGMTMIENAANSKANNTDAEKIALIKVDNLRFRRYELVGVLTEIRLVLSADVTYDTYQNGQPVTLTNPIQVERSYQYNEASVSTDDQQGDQIRDWLYDSLARRITDQYVAISLPKVAPNTSKARQTAPMLEHSAPSTTVVTTPTS